MFTVYKKVEKDNVFLTGIESLYNGLDYDRPFLFSIGGNSQNNFELLQKSLELARIYSKDDKGALFNLDAFHADFISFAYEKNDLEKDFVFGLATNYFYPYLTAKGNDYENIKKQAQKMNFLSFSTAGHKVFTGIENTLITLLKNNGLNDEQINNILGQISLGCIGASVAHYKNKVSTVYFADVNDKFVSNKNYLKDKLNASGQKCAAGGIEGNIIFIFEGNGKNDINNYFNRNGLGFGGMAYVTSFYLENSITNNQPFSIDKLLNTILTAQEKNNFSIEELDKNLIYAGAKRYTDESIILREKLDSVCEQVSLQPKSVDDSINFLLNEIKERCSDTVYYQICVKLGLVKNPSMEVMSRKTDREIINGIQELLCMTTSTKDNKVKEKKGDK